jgi:hypothetical protein
VDSSHSGEGNNSSGQVASAGALPAYGTTGKEFKLWIDYVYDLFGAALDRPVRRYLVSLGIAALLYTLTFTIALAFGFAQLYVSSPGVYIVLIAVTWGMHALRWLSQTYHVRTNKLRPCFLIDDAPYTDLAAHYARRATNNGQIFAISLCLALVFSAYFGAIYVAPNEIRQLALVAFPPALPSEWHTGAALLPKFLCLCIASIFASVTFVSGAYIMFQTLPFYSRLASLPIIPLPNVIVELWTGVLDLYQAGALMWSVGILVAELVYGIHVDILAIAVVITVSIFGMLAFLQPRRALGRIFRRAKSETIELALKTYRNATQTDKPIQDLTELDSFVRFALINPRTALNPGQIAALAVAQLIPILPFFISAGPKWLPFP